MPVECVQEVVTDSNFHLGDHQIIYGDELIVTSEDVPQSEEIVGSDSDPYVGMYESVPIPVPTTDVLDSNHLRNFVNKPQKLKIKREIKREFDFESLSDGRIRNHGSWQQKQVSIKTLEGEFSVTMWASGADDGKLRYFGAFLPFYIPSTARKPGLAKYRIVVVVNIYIKKKLFSCVSKKIPNNWVLLTKHKSNIQFYLKY